MIRLAVTGAAGIVGTGLRAELRRRGYRLHLIDRRPVAGLQPGESSAIVDIADRDALTAQLAACDGVLHLAACTSDAGWDEQIEGSVRGAINLFDAARAAGVRRVVYASSHHVVGLYPRSARPSADAVLRPDSRYGVGKAFGEALAALYALKYGMSVLAIRIGNANDRPVDRRRLGNWISWRDLAALVAIGIEHPTLVFEVVYGISDSSGRHYDNSAAARLGFRPQDDPAAYEARVVRDDPEPAEGAGLSIAELSLGGQFSEAEFEGEPRRILAGGGQDQGR